MINQHPSVFAKQELLSDLAQQADLYYEPEKYLLVVNAANMDKDWDWCVSHNTEGAELENSSDNIGRDYHIVLAGKLSNFKSIIWNR